MKRRAFTLIELLVVIGIMAVMVTVGVVNVRAGQKASRVKAAARDVFATIHHARSTALVTQQPAIITYATEERDGEVCAKIEITSTKLIGKTIERSEIQSLTGTPIKWPEEDIPEKSLETEGQSEGESFEEILFAPIDDQVVQEMRIKVVVGDESEDGASAAPSKVSVFSNVEYLLGKYQQAKKNGVEKANDKADGQAVIGESQEPVSVVWEPNGRVDPHRVWIYPDGTRPEDGLQIKVDRYGAAKVISGDGKEDD